MIRLALFCLCSAAFAVDLEWAARVGGRAELNPDGSVKALSFHGGWVTDADLDRIAAMPSIEALDLSLTRITDLGLLRLKPLKNVRSLQLFYAELITDEGLAVMRNWQRLERLNVRGTKVTDNTLALLAGKKTIRQLDIGYAEVTDSGLQHLSTLPSLQQLALGGNKLTEVGLQVLRALPQLRVLELNGRQRTDSGLWALTITDVGLEPVAAVTELRELNASGLGITSRGLEKLQGLPLEKLDLHGCRRIDNEAVARLAAIKTLKWVDLNGTAVNQKGLAELRAARPDLRVEGEAAETVAP